MSAKVTDQTTFQQVIDMGPKALEVLKKYRLACVGCGGARNETIAKGAMAHGLDADELVRDLNSALK
ncbi:MAG: disulfide oxidoreductase [Desulfuromonas sp.]|nr:MAG: disulfide oxidoreductase [Desulfuromonas sp.]